MATTKFKGVVNVVGGFETNGITLPFPGNTQSISVTAATVTLTAATHGGKVVVFNRAAGVTATLPAATGSGETFRIYVGTAITSNSGIVQVANSSDTMIGFVLSTLAAGGTTFGESAGGTDDTITMNGSTTGGLAGSYIECVDWAANVWQVRGLLAGSGTLASALSAAV